ncbi:aminotransferase-like domain-containing protein [Nocardioides sp. GXZ039]|uniref:aminotransferase-like domain-containing protein n=1 Tax=Nocardioides sp. GXZ039 TaxID=3136018 RepID=UPI0030F466D2
MDFSELDERTPRAIAGAVSRAVRSGDLAPGARLPTVRDVAADLGVSPATVSAAWQALRRTGLVVSRGRAGTFVRDTPTAWLSPRVRGLVGAGPERLPFDLSRGIPDPALLPSLGPALARVSARAATLAYHEEPVLPALRETLAATWPYPAESITVVNGATDAVGRTLEQLVSYGDRVVLESPGFPPFFDLVEALGAEVVPVAVDAEGLRVDALRRALATRPVAVVLQPRAHNPTGAAMTPERAQALASTLRRRRAAREVVPWIIEDDHSGAISVTPDVTLGTWLPDRVVHVRSYSKSHGPDLRIAAVGGPASLIDRVVARRMLGPSWTSRMLQSILLDLLTSPDSAEEVSQARRHYVGRQHAITTALREHGVVLPPPDGINLWLPVADVAAASVQLAAAGIRVATGSAFLADPDHAVDSHLRVTTGLVTPADAPHVAAELAAAARAQ